MQFLVETPNIDGEGLAEEIQSNLSLMLQVFDEKELAAFSVVIVEMEIFTDDGPSFFPRIIAIFDDEIVTNFVMFNPINISFIAAGIVAGYMEHFRNMYDYAVAKNLLDF